MRARKLNYCEIHHTLFTENGDFSVSYHISLSERISFILVLTLSAAKRTFAVDQKTVIPEPCVTDKKMSVAGLPRSVKAV